MKTYVKKIKDFALTAILVFVPVLLISACNDLSSETDTPFLYSEADPAPAATGLSAGLQLSH